MSVAFRSRSPTRLGRHGTRATPDEEALTAEPTNARQTLEVEGKPLLSPAGTAGTARGTPGQLPGQPPSHEEEPIDWLVTSLLFFFPAVGGLLFGYDIGATSVALVSMTSAQRLGTF